MKLKSSEDIDSNCQICFGETKNLVAEEKTINIPQKHEKEDLKAAVINFIWHLKRQNYAEDTLYSDKLLKMLQELPHVKANFIFNYKTKHVCSQSFRRMRKHAVKKLANPELKKIDFYTFR